MNIEKEQQGQKPYSFALGLSQSVGSGLGFALGIIGPTEPIGLVIVFLLLLMKFSLSWAITAGIIGWSLTQVYDPSSIGYFILNHESMKELWTELYNIPFVAISGFNKTKIMGGLLLGLLFLFPSMIVSWYIQAKGLGENPTSSVESER